MPAWKTLRVVVELRTRNPDYNAKDLAWQVRRRLGKAEFARDYCEGIISREASGIGFPRVVEYNRQLAAMERAAMERAERENENEA